MLSHQRSSTWANAQNIMSCYDQKVIVHKLMDFYRKSHIYNQDLQLLLPYFKQVDTILEVGPGFGRVLDFLLQNCLPLSVSAVETSSIFCDYLSRRYLADVTLHHRNILQFDSDHQFDMVLLLWSTIVDFVAFEQQQLIDKLSHVLSDDGFLAIDMLIDPLRSGSATDYSGRELSIDDGMIRHRGYLPTKNELNAMAHNAGLELFDAIEYVVPKSSDQPLRVLSIFRKR